MVTRKIKSLSLIVLVANIDKSQLTDVHVEIPFIKSPKTEKLIAAAQSRVSEGKCIEIKETQVIEKLYGMSEECFINNAIELDPETRKPLDKEGE